MKIFCLFSVENNYDQPDNNLIAWWKEKPSFDTLAKAAGLKGFPCDADQDTLFVVNLWQGQPSQDKFNCAYRLEELSEGVIK